MRFLDKEVWGKLPLQLPGKQPPPSAHQGRAKNLHEPVQPQLKPHMTTVGGRGVLNPAGFGVQRSSS